MKKYIIFSLLFFCSSFSTQAQQDTIPNADFEYWDGALFPTYWESNNCPMCVPPWETWVIQPDSNSVYSGNYSAKFLYSNGPIGHWTVPAWAKIKFPIQSKPVSLNAYVKTEMHAPDPVKIEVFLFYINNIVDLGFWQSDSSINQWTQINIPISNNSSNADSVQIIITGGIQVSDTTLTNDTKFWVDNLYFDFNTNVPDVALKNELLKIYPNPTNNNSNFDFIKNDFTNYTFKIFDSQGKLMKEFILNNERESILERENLKQGIYFIQVTNTEGLIHSGKWVIY